MPICQRNEFLDGDESDEELEGGYDSEAAEQSRNDAVRQAKKRRKIHTESDGSFDGSDDSDGAISEDGRSIVLPENVDEHRSPKGNTSDTNDSDHNAPQIDLDSRPSNTLKRNESTTATKHAATAQRAVHKSGVVYISRVPPFMKPYTLKHFLELHASKGIGRIFLTPEDHTTHVRRVKSGGNKKKSFVDGWVEFHSKREAQIVAQTLNGNIIGGKKRNFYHDDLWNIKYLKGFKWNHLTEQISNENAERAARLREEIRRTRKENKSFVEDVERAKMLKGMETKREGKKREQNGDGPVGDIPLHKKPTREFKQRQVQIKEARDGGDQPSAELSRVLGKIF